MRPALAFFALCGACYAPQIPTGITCLPADPACPSGQICTAIGSDHVCLPPGSSGVDAATDDPTDAPTDDTIPPDGPVAAACPADTNLKLCFSFDAPTLANPLANEGSSAVSANLTNVSRIAQGTGGAALVGTTSEIYVPMNTALSNIVSIEATFRLDADPPANGRVGIVDAETTVDPLSLFYYRDPNHRLRCQLGSTLFGAYTVPLGSYVRVTCVCSGGTIELFVDGVKIASGSNCSPGDGRQYGVQIGQNGNAITGGLGDEWLVGALDRVQLWSIPIAAAK